MKHFVPMATATLFCMAGSVVRAAELDTGKPLICATVEAIDCVPGAGCIKGVPDEMGAPTFMRIDLEKKEVAGPQRTSPIRYMDKLSDRTLLQGTELGFAWTLMFDGQGKMNATMADDNGVFVLFGSCTTR